MHHLPRLQEIPPLAQAIAAKFGALPQVVAVALAGSRTTGVSNETSDYDFFVYVEDDIPVDIRMAIAQEFVEQIEINNQFWEPGDEWIDIAVAKAIRTKPNLETLTRQSFPFCLLSSALCLLLYQFWRWC